MSSLPASAVRFFTMPKSLDGSLASSNSPPSSSEAPRSQESAAASNNAFPNAAQEPLASHRARHKQGITFASQDKLPKLPIPELDSSCQKYLDALKPLQSGREHADSTAAVQEFLRSEGPDLQERLRKYATGKTSYIEQFWYDSYLNFDNPVVLNLNPFFLLEDDPTPARNNQVTRAASLVVSALSFVRAIRKEELPPDTLRDTPLCMYQYSRIFGTARVPTENGCHIGQDPHSKHIVVMDRGQFYWFDVLDENSDIIMTEKDLAMNLQAIVDDAQQTPIQDAAKGAVGVLSTENRKVWAGLRDVLTREEGSNNSDCLGIVDSALFIVCLDYTSPKTGADLCMNMLCGTSKVEKGVQVGTCTNRWYDKLQIIVCKNGSAGINFEHTGVDGHTVLRMASDVYTDTILRFARTINGQAPSLWASASPDPSKRDPKSFGDVSTTPHKLEWDMLPELNTALRFAETRLADLIQQNEFQTLDFKGYGKNFMTSMGFSPDAFVQMAFQAAYYGLYGRIECGYEPAMTKIYLHGRTEAVRPVTSESTDFVRTFWADNPASSKVDALRKACQKHTAMTKECAKAQGQDRHLYAIFCVWQRAVDEEGAEATSSIGVSSSAGYASSVDGVNDGASDTAGSGRGGGGGGGGGNPPHSPPPETSSERDSVSRSPGGGSGHGSSSSRPRGQSSPQQMPAIFADPGWDKLNNTILSTSNCGNPSLRQFGFGPTSGEGFGIGYIIKDESVSICASSKHRQTKRYVDAIESYFLEIRKLLRASSGPSGSRAGHAQHTRASPNSSRAREVDEGRSKSGRIKSRGRVIPSGAGKAGGAESPDLSDSRMESDEEGLGGYGFFDAGMLLQALKTTKHSSTNPDGTVPAGGTERDDGKNASAASGPAAAVTRRNIGKKLRLADY